MRAPAIVLALAVALATAGCSSPPAGSPAPAAPAPAAEAPAAPAAGSPAAAPACIAWPRLMGMEGPAIGATPGALPSFELPAGVTPAAAPSAAPAAGCELEAEASRLLGRTVEICCGDEATDASEIVRGCRRRTACSYAIDGRRGLRTRAELGAALAPVDTAAEALALAALATPDAWVPTSPADAGAEAKRWGWQAIDPARPAVEVAAAGDGWRVAVPAYSTCGCSHPLWQLVLAVGRDGAVCPVEEPRALASSSAGVCVD